MRYQLRVLVKNNKSAPPWLASVGCNIYIDHFWADSTNEAIEIANNLGPFDYADRVSLTCRGQVTEIKKS
jgi:hypothetical protein